MAPRGRNFRPSQLLRSFSFSPQRVYTPGHAGPQHQDRTGKRRGGKSGEYKYDESSDREEEADNLDHA